MRQFTVNGAVVSCGSGTDSAIFTPPKRGVLVGDRWVGTEFDTSADAFAGTFGKCRITGDLCSMSFMKRWFNACSSVYLEEYQGKEPEALLTMQSCLVCMQGDKVVFKTDGQEEKDQFDGNGSAQNIV